MSEEVFLKIIIVILTAIIGYFFSNLSSRETKVSKNIDQSLEDIVEKMYKDFLALDKSRVTRNEMNNIIRKYVTNESLYKLCDRELILDILFLYSYEAEKLNDNEYRSKLYGIAKKIERIYWDRVTYISSFVNWETYKRTNSKIMVILTGAYFKMKNLIENLTGAFILLSIISVTDLLINWKNELHAVPKIINIYVIIFTIIFIGLYFIIAKAYNEQRNKDFIKQKNLIK